MANVTMSQHYPMPASEIWKIVGNFQGLADWHPLIEKSAPEEGGKKRRLTLPDGGIVIEELIEQDDGTKIQVYEIRESKLPLTGYRATIKVSDDPDGKGCTVEWSGSFEPTSSEKEAADIVQAVYSNGLDQLKRMFGG